jgi:TP901 family phage tail tape measure protein
MAKKQQTVYEIKIKGLDDIKSLNKEINKLNGQYDDLKQESKGLGNDIEGVGKAAKGTGGNMNNMTKAYAAAILATDAFKKALSILKKEIAKGIVTFKDFEFAMTKVKAISGASEAEFKKLQSSAKSLGRTTFFTAKDVANLQLNLSKLGFRTNEILDAQEAILMLSQAMGSDLARTATVVAASIRGFGEDTEQTGRFADVMAAAFSNSALDLEKFQTSMTKVSAIAATAGFSFEETTGLLGILTDRGIEASIAGTSLRNIFLKLQDPTSDLSNRLGRTVHSGEDLIVALKELDASGIDVAGVMKIVDDRQVQAMESFIRSSDAISDFNDILNNASGSAEDMSDIMENTLQGAVLRTKSAYEGFVLKLLEGNGLLKDFTDLVASSLSKWTFVLTSPEQKGLDTAMKQFKDLKDDIIDYNAEISKSGEGTKRSISEEALELLSEYEEVLENRKERLKTASSGLFGLGGEKEELEETVKNFQARVDAMRDLIDSQIEKEEEQAKKDEENKRQQAENAEKLSIQLKELIEYRDGLVDRGDNLNEIGKQELITTNQQIKALEEQIKKLKELGVEKEKQGKVIPDASIDEETQLQIQRSQDEARRQFNEGIIETEEALKAELLDIELKSIQQALEFKNLSVEDEIALNNRLAEVTIKNNRRIAKSEADKRKKQDDAVDKIKETGELLMRIGEVEGENSKIRQIGIKITQAAAVAEGFLALTRGLGSITNQGVSGDPFTAIARVAAMAAQLASVIANLKALTGGGGGGGGSSDGEATFLQDSQGNQFANGGLTRGGMFVGNSHANGGVKFRVGGRIHEAEGGEAIINKKSTSMFRPVLSAINSYNGNGVKFADGGLLNSGEKFAMGGELRSAQQLISGGMGTSKVVIVESDMTEVQNRISAIESQATF